MKDKLEGETIKVYDEELKIWPATHPTNIIWDAHGVRSKIPEWARKLILLVIALCFVFTYVTILVWITQNKIEIDYMKKPPGIDCQVINENGKNDKGYILYAYHEYTNFIKNYDGIGNLLKGNMSSRIAKSGYLSCFCDY